jgi:hypothetical protein
MPQITFSGYLSAVLRYITAVAASLDIFFALEPALLRAANLDQILPALTEIEKIVQSWANYILRTLAAGHTTAELLTAPGQRARLENLLHHTLQDRLQPFGVRIYTLRLLYYPVPLMLEAQLVATRTELVAQARAHAMEKLAAALGPAHNLSHLLPLELLQRIQADDTTAFNFLLPVASQVENQDSFATHWVLTSH